jgi:hypothetical protein
MRKTSSLETSSKFSLWKFLLNYFHRVDLFMMGIAAILGLLNCHYFFFINLNMIVEISADSPTITSVLPTSSESISKVNGLQVTSTST